MSELSNKICLIEQCDKQARSKKLCDMHYKRMRRNSRKALVAQAVNKRGASCSVQGCTDKYESSGYCSLHRSRFRTGAKLEGQRKGHRHGLSKHPLYSVWSSMWRRCDYAKAINYHLYGGRGIKVCDRWKNFALFLEDVGERPESKSLDRIDVNGNYEPSNIRWATSKEQAQNRRKLVCRFCGKEN